MITAIGLMIGLYILARYVEMSHDVGIGTKITLVMFSLITILCILIILAKDYQSCPPW